MSLRRGTLCVGESQTQQSLHVDALGFAGAAREPPFALCGSACVIPSRWPSLADARDFLSSPIISLCLASTVLTRVPIVERMLYTLSRRLSRASCRSLIAPDTISVSTLVFIAEGPPLRSRLLARRNAGGLALDSLGLCCGDSLRTVFAKESAEGRLTRSGVRLGGTVNGCSVSSLELSLFLRPRCSGPGSTPLAGESGIPPGTDLDIAGSGRRLRLLEAD